MLDKIEINASGLIDIDADFLGDALKQSVSNCITCQKEAALQAKVHYQADSEALDKVSPKSLDMLLAKRINIHGISTNRSISNVISFGAKPIEGGVDDRRVEQARIEVDKAVAAKLKGLFNSEEQLTIVPSGHFWYPPGGFMSWHTNSQAPGWRIYINYAVEEGQSFFRYRDPNSHQVKTLNDKQWNVRVFKVTNKQPLWHCVYSNTDRFSLGYMITTSPTKSHLLNYLKRKVLRS